MSIRWTKRLQNFCRSCGYSWYPRGKDRSAQCPHCGSPEVELAIEALLRALAYLIAAPFILTALLVQWLIMLIRWLVHWIGLGAAEVVKASAPVRSKAWNWAAQAATKCWSGWFFFIRWVLSVKDDLLTEGDRDVNPVGLIAKLVTIVVVLMAIIILVIETVGAIRRL